MCATQAMSSLLDSKRFPNKFVFTQTHNRTNLCRLFLSAFPLKSHTKSVHNGLQHAAWMRPLVRNEAYFYWYSSWYAYLKLIAHRLNALFTQNNNLLKQEHAFFHVASLFHSVSHACKYSNRISFNVSPLIIRCQSQGNIFIKFIHCNVNSSVVEGFFPVVRRSYSKCITDVNIFFSFAVINWMQFLPEPKAFQTLQLVQFQWILFYGQFSGELCWNRFLPHCTSCCHNHVYYL